jgi:hypothetical protein
MTDWIKREENEEKANELVEKLGLKNFDKRSISFLMERIDEWNEKVEKGEIKSQKKTFSEEKLVQADKWITERNERAAKFFEELGNPKRLEPMFDYIRKIVGISDLTFTINVGKKYIGFTSNDISDNFIIRNAWADFRIGNFNSGLSKEKYEDGVDKYDIKKEETDLSKPAKINYWWSIHYNYEHLDGGTNGARIADAWVDDKFNWTFRSEKELYEQRKAEREEMEQRWKELTKAV